MSTKIYDGIRFTETNLTKLYSLFDNLRTQMYATVKDITLDRVAWEAARVIDLRHVDLLKASHSSAFHNEPIDLTNKSVFSYALTHYWESWQKEKNSTTGYDHFYVHCNVTVHPISARKVLGIPYGDRVLTKMLTDQPWVQEYGYWNNVDRPDELTTRQWNVRCNDWDKALPDNRLNIPAQSGYMIELAPVNPVYFNPNELLQHMPSIERRSRYVAERIIYDEEWAKVSVEDKEQLSNYTRMTRRDDVKQRVEQMIVDLSARLPEITQELIISSP